MNTNSIEFAFQYILDTFIWGNLMQTKPLCSRIALTNYINHQFHHQNKITIWWSLDTCIDHKLVLFIEYQLQLAFHESSKNTRTQGTLLDVLYTKNDGSKSVWIHRWSTQMFVSNSIRSEQSAQSCVRGHRGCLHKDQHGPVQKV